MVERNRDPSHPAMPIFFDECEKHSRMEERLDRIESQGSEAIRTILQQQRDTHARFGDLARTMDRQTGKIDGLAVAVHQFLARQDGIADGKAEITGEIATKVRNWGKVAKWVGGIIAAALAGGGGVELLRRMIGGE